MRIVSGLGKSLALVVGVLAGISALPARADEAFEAFWTQFVTALSGATSYDLSGAGLTLYILNEGRLEFTAAT